MATVASDAPLDRMTMPPDLTDQIVATTKLGHRIQTAAVWRRSPTESSSRSLEVHALLKIDFDDLPVYIQLDNTFYQVSEISYTQTRESAMAVMVCYRGVLTDDSDYATVQIPKVIDAPQYIQAPAL